MFTDASYSSPKPFTIAELSYLRDVQQFFQHGWITLQAMTRSPFVADTLQHWQQQSPQVLMGVLTGLPAMGVVMWLLTTMRSPVPQMPAVSETADSAPIASHSASSPTGLTFDLSDTPTPASDRTADDNPFIWPPDHADTADLDNPFVWMDDPQLTEMVNDAIALFSQPDSTTHADCESCVQSTGLTVWFNSKRLDDPLFAGEMNSLVARAVGAAEGTRSVTGDRTPAYYGHTDPGNGVWNLGTFSYQHGATSPEAADRKQLDRLRTQAQTLRSLAATHNIRLTNEIMLNGIDLANQAPEAALSENGGYIQRLREAYEDGYFGAEAVLEARVHSYIDPMTNRWDAPGLGNTHSRIRADQLRRQTAIAHVIHDFTAEHGPQFAAHRPYHAPSMEPEIPTDDVGAIAQTPSDTTSPPDPVPHVADAPNTLDDESMRLAQAPLNGTSSDRPSSHQDEMPLVF